MVKAIIDSSYKFEFERSPLFFMRVESREVQNSSDRRDVSLEYYWDSAVSQVDCTIESKEMAIDGTLKLMIANYPFIISKIQLEKKEPSKANVKLSYQVHPFSPASYYDMLFLTNRMLTRKQNYKDNFYFQELLWVLDNYEFNENTITQVLSQYNEFYVNETINVFHDIGHCLSYEKQERIANYLKKRNVDYKIYFPRTLSEALSNTNKRIQGVGNKRNIFRILSLLLGYSSLASIDKIGDESEEKQYVHYEESVLKSSSNDIIRLYRWLKDGDYNYGNLAPIIRLFSLLEPQIQLDVVKRYFHAIRLTQTVYSDEILTAFLNNRYKKFERLCNVLTANLSPLDMTVPLLCDNIQCFIKSNGTSFQSFNGVLDCTFMNVNPLYSEINFNLNKILPTCNGGAVYDSNFIGFINYRLIIELAKENFKEDYLKQNVINLLNAIGKREYKYIYTCHTEGEKEESLMHPMCKSCYIAQKKKIDLNIWQIYDEQYKELFTHILNIPHPSNKYDSLNINFDDIDLILFRERLASFFDKKSESHDDKWLIKPDFYKNYITLLQIFCNISTVRISIRNNIVIGCRVLDVDYVPSKGIDPNKAEKERRNKEVEITIQRVKNALEYITGYEIKNNVLELPYDPIKLDEICKIFYHRIDETEDNLNKLHFLSHRRISKYFIYCAPEYENNINDATNLPYFWCQQKECFRNVLSNQVLANTKSWNEYTLFHILEICGFPLLKETTAGFEANAVIRNIIAIINKIKIFFEKLKCEVCGHLIWSKHSGPFNNYNRFVCINNLCPEHNKEVYLSYCNKCKKGLIDSRDSAQCPNGWRICPLCYGCCNDETIESVVQRYIVSHKPIPPLIEKQRGNGHNNKNIYFCPKCGGKIISILNEKQNNVIYQCENCGHQKRQQ